MSMNTIGFGFSGGGSTIKLCKRGTKPLSRSDTDVFFNVDFLGVDDFLGVSEAFLGAIVLNKRSQLCIMFSLINKE